MRRLRLLFLTVLALSLAPGPCESQVPEISVSLPVRADSVCSTFRQILRNRHFSIVRLDSAARTVEAISPESPFVRVSASRGEGTGSAMLTIRAEARGSETAGLATLLDLAGAIRPHTAGLRQSAPDGGAWPTDAQNRVGFMVLT